MNNSKNAAIADIRKDYSLQSLDISDVLHNPLAQFDAWLDAAIRAEVHEPTAMHLSTISSEGRPSGRIVLLKGVDTGFVFFSNYTSRKGAELAASSFASLTFFWPELERQVRIEGSVERVSAEESDTYFNSRPHLSRLGACASAQSQATESRATLEQKMAELGAKYPEGSSIPRPEHWGGYRLQADCVEFWQGRRSRLHDRIVYHAPNDGRWQISRLQP